MTIRRLQRPLLLLGVFSVVSMAVVRDTHGASLCPGDDNNDQRVTIDELVRAVSAALQGCPEPTEGCGNGVVEPELGEECDRADLGGESCVSLGFSGGALACTGACAFDTGACTSGGGLLQTGQTLCDQGSGRLGACPGSPPGQDGAVRAGVSFTYTDNGDGTITDNVTGLTWEKLSDDGSIHDWDNTYTWYDAFSVKIAGLNRASFAGHNDWRLPNRRELESLVHVGRVAGLNPAVDPAFDTGCTAGCGATTCSCTQPDNYWSSTTFQDLTDFAWDVDFSLGIVNAHDKTLGAFPGGAYARAVRGGL